MATVITRRAFVRGGVSLATFAAGMAVDQAVEVLAIEPLLQDDRPEPAYTLLNRRQFDAKANDEQRASVDLASADLDTIRERGPTWGTYAERTDAGEWVIRWQGAGIRAHIWPDRDMAGVAMDQQPDPRFGAWAARRMTVASLSGEPSFQACETWIDTLGRVERYTAALVPVGRRGMLSTTSLIA